MLQTERLRPRERAAKWQSQETQWSMGPESLVTALPDLRGQDVGEAQTELAGSQSHTTPVAGTCGLMVGWRVW